MKRGVSKGFSRFKDTIKKLAIRSPSSKDSDCSNSSQDNASSTAENPDIDWFDENFEMMDPIGKGGFATVYTCKKRGTDEKYAVKVVDIRPLRLKESFKPSQLQREVDIMRKLHHPNIIEFIGVQERTDSLLMVLEYAPGKELFEVIIAKQKFTEAEAKPVINQIADAVRYIHSMDILHRDIKPENILVIENPTTRDLTVKLLDFGLSKYSGMGSAAKSFVGTPCYVAPEVEAASRMHGRTYGPAVDCWSLGAVLYVMLVARFPEFHYLGNAKTLVLPPDLWNDASEEAKHLVRGLIHYDPNARLSANAVLRHPWLSDQGGDPNSFDTMEEVAYRHPVSAFPTPLPPPLSSPLTPPTAQPPTPIVSAKEGGEVMTMVLQPEAAPEMREVLKEAVEGDKTAVTVGKCNLPLGPLLMLQKNIAHCLSLGKRLCALKNGLSCKLDDAGGIIKNQIVSTVKLLGKMEQTSLLVLHLFPDLELAVEEHEGELASVFFKEVSEFTVSLLELVTQAQEANERSSVRVKELINFVYDKVLEDAKEAGATVESKADLRMAVARLQDKTGGEEFTREDVITLMGYLFQDGDPNRESPGGGSSHTGDLSNSSSESSVGYTSNDTDAVDGIMGQASGYLAGGDSLQFPFDSTTSSMGIEGQDSEEYEMRGTGPTTPSSGNQGHHQQQSGPGFGRVDDPEMNEIKQQFAEEIVRMNDDLSTALTPEQIANLRINDFSVCPFTYALQCLQKVGVIIKQLNDFWSSTETVLEVLTMKGRHAEKFISFSHNPKLMEKFKGRISEYRAFWEGVSAMTGTYLLGVSEMELQMEKQCGTHH